MAWKLLPHRPQSGTRRRIHGLATDDETSRRLSRCGRVRRLVVHLRAGERAIVSQALCMPIALRRVVRKPIVVSLFVALIAVSLQAQGVWGTRAISRRFVVSGSRLFAAEGRG